jgi:hypothetical protein
MNNSAVSFRSPVNLKDFDGIVSLLEGRYNSVMDKTNLLSSYVEDIQQYGVTPQIHNNIAEAVRTLDAELLDMFSGEGVIYFEMRNFFPDNSFIKAFESENKLIYTLLDPLRSLFSTEEYSEGSRDVIVTELIFMAEIIQRNINKKKAVLFKQVKKILSSEEQNILTQRINTLYFTRFSIN